MLEVKGLSVHFGGLKAVEKVDLKVVKGEILSLIGPNGAGKTTFFNLVSGFLRPHEGNMVFKGRDITHLPPHRIAALGLVRTFQKTNIFADIDVAESVRIGFSSSRTASFPDILLHGKQSRREQAYVKERTDELLHFTGLFGLRSCLVKNIPYGKQRMLAIALALAADPELLLLDEPATGINPVETGELRDMILRIRSERGITIFMIEHNMNLVASISDRVVVLNHGEKLAEGLPSEIARNPLVVEAYLGRGYAHAS